MISWRKVFPWILEKRVQRAPRIKLGALENCWLIYKKENLIRKFEIQTISTSGIGLLLEKASPFNPGESFLVTLVLGEKKVTAGFKVMYVDDSSIGCMFDQENISLTAEIYDYLKVQIAAHGLTPVNKKFLDAEIRDKATWLTDGRNNEIYYLIENNMIQEFQISFLGNHLSGGQDKELLYGKLNQKDDLEPWITWEILDSNPFRSTLPHLAKQFIQQVVEIPEPIKKLLSKAIDQSLAYRTNL